MPRLTTAVETYFAELKRIRASGGATAETSRYTPLENLLNAVGSSLKPKVTCVGQLADLGAGHPDFGLYAAKQVKGHELREGQLPEHGVVEVKPLSDDAWVTADGKQVSKYWGLYRLVLVTNYRDFVLIGEDAAGMPAKLETFRLAADAEDFNRQLNKPRAFANRVGAGLGEYLLRVLSHRAVLAEPRDLARLLASYARDGLARVEAAGEAPSLAAVRGGAGRGAGRQVRGRARRGLLPLHPGANALLRRLLRLGALGAPNAAAHWRVQLVRGRPAPTHAGAAGALPPAFRSRPLAAVGP